MTARILGVHLDDDPAVTAADIPGHAWGGAFVSNRGRPLPKNTTARRLIDLVRKGAQPHLAAGGGCIVRIKIDMVACVRGDWDDRLTALGAACVGLNIMIILRHEPEDEMSAAVFVPAFNRGRRALKAEHAGLEVAYAGMAYQWRHGSPSTADPRAWCEDLHADRYLIDLYFGKNFKSSYTLADHPGRVRWHANMIAPYPERHDLAGIAEWGRLAEPDRPAGFAEDFRWLAEDPVGRTYGVVCPWGTDGQEAEAGWLLDAASRAAIRDGFARLAAPAQPAGFTLSDLDHVLICQRRGCLVDATLADRHTHL